MPHRAFFCFIPWTNSFYPRLPPSLSLQSTATTARAHAHSHMALRIALEVRFSVLDVGQLFQISQCALSVATVSTKSDLTPGPRLPHKLSLVLFSWKREKNHLQFFLCVCLMQPQLLKHTTVRHRSSGEKCLRCLRCLIHSTD